MQSYHKQTLKSWGCSETEIRAGVLLLRLHLRFYSRLDRSACWTWVRFARYRVIMNNELQRCTNHIKCVCIGLGKREINSLNYWCYRAKRKCCHYTHFLHVGRFNLWACFGFYNVFLHISNGSFKILDMSLQCSMLTLCKLCLSTHSGCWSCASPWRWRTRAPRRAECSGLHNCDPWSWPCASSPDGCFRWHPCASWRASWWAN